MGRSEFRSRLDSTACIPGLFGEGNSFFVDGAAQLDVGMKTFPGHAPGPCQHRFGVGQFGTVPVLFQDSPATLHWIVFAMVRPVSYTHLTLPTSDLV